jgi:cephalosporin-C deacetylase-like acetyl esterase
MGMVLMVAGCASPPAQSASAGQPSGSAQPPASVQPSTEPDLASLTAYDASAPLDLRDENPPQTDADGVTVHDVSWVSTGGGRVSAWLVVPPGDGPFAGIVYLHGSETDRNDFLDEAVAMAHGGAVSVVMDAPFARTGDSRHDELLNFGHPDRERDMNAQAIVDMRRAYDLLAARADIDPARLGFVGHSWGASAGAVLAAVDSRPVALVLISGRPSWTGFLRESTDAWVAAYKSVYADRWDAYLATLAPFDALPVIGSIDPGRLYFQYGRLDDVVPTSVSAELLAAAPLAKADLYDAGHALNAAATADRVAWLVERLGLQPISADVVAGVGLPDE